MNHLICMACVCIVAAGFHVNTAFAGDTPKAKGAKPKIPDKLHVVFNTSKGEIRLVLFPEEAPLTVASFVNLAQRGYYDGLLFHRVLKDFMIQGGDPTGTGRSGPGYKFKDEFSPKLRHDGPGILSMANSGPGTNGSQFFITHKATPWLNDKHSIFGKVVTGQDVVNAIAKGDVMKTVRIEGNSGELFKKHTRELAAWNKTLDVRFPRKPTNPEEVKKLEEKRAATTWKQAMDLVKTHGGDPNKGQKSSTGLWHVDLAEGTGASPSTTDKVQVHYTGWFTNGKKFDSSVDRGQPYSFSLQGGVIKGWLEGVASMRVGGKRLLVIPPDLAYGATGRPGIPPNATLVFQVELLQINP